MLKFAITDHAMQMAIEQHGMEGMTRGELSAMITKYKRKTSFSAAAVVAAAKRVRFKKRVMGWM